SILDNPDDDANRLVFADWLEESGQPDKAAFVRLEGELGRMSRVHERFLALKDELKRLNDSVGWRGSLTLFRNDRPLNCGVPDILPDNAPGGTIRFSAAGRFAARFEYECPNRWVDLRRTDDVAVRYCEECRKTVHYCASQEEAEQHAVRGDCIAISSRVAL